jgi:hypothetical protein
MGQKKRIDIEVRNKIATLKNPDDYLVCGNNDYEVVFSFDGDWDGVSAKTAVFVYGNTPIHKPFVGNICEGVEIKNATLCAIGVFAGDIKTTTGATILCNPSIRDLGGVPKPPTKEVYDEIMALLDKAIEAHTELPVGGKAGQVLKKVSDKDYDTEWANDEQRDLSEINKKLENKLDKTTESNKIYGTDANGNQKSYDVSASQTEGVALRRKGGHIELPSVPINPTDAASKQYVDKVSKRVDKLEGILIKKTVDDSVAYEKRVPEASAQKAIVSRIGGATSKVDFEVINRDYDIVKESISDVLLLGTLEKGDYTIDLTLISQSGDGDVSSINYIYATGESGDEYYFEFDALGDFTLPEKCSVECVFNFISEELTSCVYNVAVTRRNVLVIAPVTAIVSEGRNLIPFPYINAIGVGYTKTISGVTWTVNYDGSVTANGTATATSTLSLISLSDSKSTFEGMITFSGVPEGGKYNKTFWMPVSFSNANTGAISNMALTVPRTYNLAKGILTMQLAIAKDYTANNLTFYPKMVYEADTHTYEIPEAIRSRYGYGEADPDDWSLYNYIDFDNEIERLEGKIDEYGSWVGVSDETVSDLSHILHDFKDGKDYFFIEVQGWGTVRFENEHKIPVPSVINFAEI